MDEAAIRRAAEAGARQAFSAGMRAAANRRDESRQREDAVTYAVELICGVANQAVEQAREAGWMAAWAARDDREADAS